MITVQVPGQIHVAVLINKTMKNGYVALITVIVVSVVVLAITVSITSMGVGEIKSSLDYKKGREAEKIADFCSEEAMLKIRDDASYSGSTIFGDGHSCQINVTGNTYKTVNIEAVVDGVVEYKKYYQLDLVVAEGSVNILRWREI